MVFILADIKRTSYMGYTFPMVWELLGWAIPLLLSLCIPVVAIIRVINNRRTELGKVGSRAIIRLRANSKNSKCAQNSDGHTVPGVVYAKETEQKN